MSEYAGREPGAVTMSADLDHYLPLLESVSAGIVEMFGRNCEVVVHDFSRAEGGSIVAIAGEVTGRHVGGSLSKIGLGIRALGDDADDSYVYVMRLPDGRIVRSSTIVLRNLGRVVGALCINYDITAFDGVAVALADFQAQKSSVAASAEPVTFGDDVAQVLEDIILEETRAMGLSQKPRHKTDRQELLRRLKRKGAFTLQRAAPQVAEHLGVSRATVYTDLQVIRLQDEAVADRLDGKG